MPIPFERLAIRERKTRQRRLIPISAQLRSWLDTARVIGGKLPAINYAEKLEGGSIASAVNTPELYYMESKWSSLVSYGMSLNLLKDCLPISEKLSIETVRQHTYRVAAKLEAEVHSLLNKRFSKLPP